MFAGIPAKCRLQGVDRIYSYKEEAIYDQQFNYIRYKL